MIRLETDFNDYYDTECNQNSNIVYVRLQADKKSRGEELNELRRFGIKTIQFGPLSKFSPLVNKKLVVYTNPMLHNFEGKRIVGFDEAASQYGNCLMAEFLDKSGGYTIKYLQIGQRRFNLMFYNPDYMDKLVEGSLVKIEELPKQYNYAIGVPIFSIDYISNGVEMIAVDFNTTQSLISIGLDKVIPASDVAREIRDALVVYNKV